jgi:hypothetical protein
VNNNNNNLSRKRERKKEEKKKAHGAFSCTRPLECVFLKKSPFSKRFSNFFGGRFEKWWRN